MKKSEEAPHGEESAGVPYPPPEEQRPYLKAFRKFVLTSKNEKGLSWTPAVILESLWELWTERPAATEARLNFHADYGRKFERMRSDEPQEYVKDGILFMLIQRFLEAHNVVVVGRPFLRSLQLLSSNFSAAFFPAVGLPRYSDTEETLPDRPLIRVYKLRKSPSLSGVYPKKILALRLTPNITSCYQGFIFDLSEMEVQVGLYMNSSKDFYARDFSRGTYVQYSLIDRNRRTGPSLRTTQFTPGGVVSERRFHQYSDLTRYECFVRRTNHPEAIKTANEIARNIFSLTL